MSWYRTYIRLGGILTSQKGMPNIEINGKLSSVEIEIDYDLDRRKNLCSDENTL